MQQPRAATWILASCLLPACALAAENYDSGAYLLEQCRKASETRSPDRWHREFCVGFISGFVGGHQLAAPSSEGGPFCLPQDATTGKLVTVVVRYLEEHPESRDLPRSEALTAALEARYPCPEVPR